MSIKAAVEVDDLRKTYTGGWFSGRTVDALKGISFEVGRGEIFGLLGPNGAGKTTFVKILLGIIQKSSGSATIMGKPAGTIDARRHIGYLPENLRMRRHHTAHTALEYYGQLSGLAVSATREKGEELLHLVGLTERAGDGIRQYSKGMLQRLGLAQALLHEPEMLVLDEPTDGLDPQARADVRSILRKLRDTEGTTIFLNSHILQEVEMICDKVAILDRGELKYVGAVKDIGAHLQAQKQQPMAAEVISAEPVSEQQTEFEVDFELEGAEAVLREVLAKRVVVNHQQTGPQEFRLTVRFPDQAAVDECVDELRSRGANIVGLSRRRVTLEAAFLQMINDPKE